MGNFSAKQKEREKKISELRTAILEVVEKKSAGMTEDDVVAAMLDAAQHKASCLIRSNPYASGIEVMLRSFSAIFKLDLYPDLADEYIGNKFRNGFVGFAWAVREHLPGGADTFDEVIHRFFGTEKETL